MHNLTDLHSALTEVENSTVRLEMARQRQRECILHAIKGQVPIKHIARAAGLTPGRIYQLKTEAENGQG